MLEPLFHATASTLWCWERTVARPPARLAYAAGLLCAGAVPLLPRAAASHLFRDAANVGQLVCLTLAIARV